MPMGLQYKRAEVHTFPSFSWELMSPWSADLKCRQQVSLLLACTALTDNV